MGKRRGHGAGSIYQRADGYWATSVDLGWKDGKRQRKVLYGKTQKEVTDKLKALHSKIEQGRPITDERRRTGDFLDTWLAEVVKPHKRPGTYRSYEEKVRLHIKPGIGHIPLAKLSAADVQRLLNEKTASHLSARSVEYIRAILRSALTTAEHWGYVSRNVAKLTTIPKVQREEVEPFTEEEVRLLLEAAKDDRLGAFYTVALAIGLRPGEALGLVWDDIDFEATPPVVRVRMGLQRVDGKLQRVDLKTDRSRRTIPLPSVCVKALKEHRKRQLEERLAAKSWDERDFVFTTKRGTPLDQSNVTGYFTRLQEKAGVERHRLYDARHTAASMLLMQGVAPRIVMEILGHSSYNLTMDTYTHVMPSLMHEAMEAMNRQLGGEAG